MCEKVIRYAPCFGGRDFNSPIVDAHPTGDYVRFEDYEKLRAENTALKEKQESDLDITVCLTGKVDKLISKYHALKDSRDELLGWLRYLISCDYSPSCIDLAHIDRSAKKAEALKEKGNE